MNIEEFWKEFKRIHYEENWEIIPKERQDKIIEIFSSNSYHNSYELSKREYLAFAKELNKPGMQEDIYIFKKFSETPEYRLTGYENCFNGLRSPPKGFDAAGCPTTNKYTPSKAAINKYNLDHRKSKVS